MDEALTFLRTLYGENAPGLICLFDPLWRRTYWNRATDLAAVVRQAGDLVQRNHDVYIRVTLVDEVARTRKGRAPSNLTVAVPALWADIDVGDVGHTKGTLPPDIDAATAVVGMLEMPPTMTVASGGGLHCYWIFEQLLMTRTPEERVGARALVDRLQAALRHRMSEQGWTLDPTADLARVLRLPGTVNFKEGGCRPVQLLSSDGPRYGWVELSSQLGDMPGGSPPKQGVAPPIRNTLTIGNRSDTLCSIAGTLRRRGLTAEEILPCLVAVNEGRCDPPLSDEKVESIARGIASRYLPGGRGQEDEQ